MAPIEAQAKPPHGPARRIGAMFAVALVMALAFVLGQWLASDVKASSRQAVSQVLFWFGLQAICILAGLAWETMRRRYRLPPLNLLRPWLRLRLRLRQRFIRDRSRDDYRRVEGALIWPIMLVAGIVLLVLTPLGLAVTLFLIAAALYFLAMVVPYYRDAPERPLAGIVFAAAFGLGIGYVAALPV